MDKTQLLQRIAARTGRHGVLTADRYFRSVDRCFDGPCAESVASIASPDQWDKALREAEQKFVYSAADAAVDTKSVCKGEDAVNNCVMRFEAVVTTTKRDRDMDVLETGGAVVDLKSPLLWNHIPVQPIGKLLRVTLHSEEMLKALFAIADTAMGRDAAVLAEMEAMRISHGFDPHEFEAMEDEEGWHFKKFEIYEVSLVSIPSNTDAVITAYSREKLHSPLIKTWARRMYEARPVVVPGADLPTVRPSDPILVDTMNTLICAVNDFAKKDTMAEQAETMVAESTEDKIDESTNDDSDVELVDELETKGVVPYSAYPIVEGSWSGSGARKRLASWAAGGGSFDSNNASHRAKYERGFGYVMEGGTTLGDYKFPHHDIRDGRMVTVKSGVSAAIGAVNGARSKPDVPESARRSIYNHLAKHLRAAGEDPPDFRADADIPDTKDLEKEFMAELAFSDLPTVERVEKQVSRLADVLRQQQDAYEWEALLNDV